MRTNEEDTQNRATGGPRRQTENTGAMRRPSQQGLEHRRHLAVPRSITEGSAGQNRGVILESAPAFTVRSRLNSGGNVIERRPLSVIYSVPLATMRGPRPGQLGSPEFYKTWTATEEELALIRRRLRDCGTEMTAATSDENQNDPVDLTTPRSILRDRLMWKNKTTGEKTEEEPSATEELEELASRISRRRDDDDDGHSDSFQRIYNVYYCRIRYDWKENIINEVIPPMPGNIPIGDLLNQQQNETREEEREEEDPARELGVEEEAQAVQHELIRYENILAEIQDLHNFLPPMETNNFLQAIENENGTDNYAQVGNLQDLNDVGPQIVSVHCMSVAGNPGSLVTRNLVEEPIPFIIIYEGPAPGLLGGMPMEGPMAGPATLEASMILEILASGLFTHTHVGEDPVVHCTGIVFVSRNTFFENRIWRCRACKIDHPEDFEMNEWDVHFIHLIGVTSSFNPNDKCVCGGQYYVLGTLDNCVSCGAAMCTYGNKIIQGQICESDYPKVKRPCDLVIFG
ncbi:hypothetical protein QAD02_016558 [Eretmocerus hayati]|uniref:Uncharacterized protein n=1 Tax=Eretmocerus hayati TaxID=131215 RepID=A0ACC2PD81_9HYME|nr:hypothetical protein QAD02_016558 [Eretmocerus hayati]